MKGGAVAGKDAYIYKVELATRKDIEKPTFKKLRKFRQGCTDI